MFPSGSFTVYFAVFPVVWSQCSQPVKLEMSWNSVPEMFLSGTFRMYWHFCPWCTTFGKFPVNAQFIQDVSSFLVSQAFPCNVPKISKSGTLSGHVPHGPLSTTLPSGPSLNVSEPSTCSSGHSPNFPDFECDPGLALLLPLVSKCSEDLPNPPPDISLELRLPHLPLNSRMLSRTSKHSKHFDNHLQNTWRLWRQPFPFLLALATHLHFVEEALKSWVSIDCFSETRTLLLIAPITRYKVHFLW